MEKFLHIISVFFIFYFLFFFESDKYIVIQIQTEWAKIMSGLNFYYSCIFLKGIFINFVILCDWKLFFAKLIAL